jgi:hypothetical protein
MTFSDASVSGKSCRKIQGIDRQGFSPAVFRHPRVDKCEPCRENLLTPYTHLPQHGPSSSRDRTRRGAPGRAGSKVQIGLPPDPKPRTPATCDLEQVLRGGRIPSRQGDRSTDRAARPLKSGLVRWTKRSVMQRSINLASVNRRFGFAWLQATRCQNHQALGGKPIMSRSRPNWA